MKKILALIAGFAFVIAAVVAITNSKTDPVFAASCVNGTVYTDFDGSRSGNDTLTVWPKKPLCKDAKVNFTTFKVLNKNYNGQPFKNNPTAIPQASYWNKTVTLKKGSTSKVTVKMSIPDACTPYQIDAYVGPVQTKVTTSAGLVNTTAIVAKLFNKTKTNCSPPVVKMVQVCDPKTGKIITVKESEASKYKPVGDIACKPPVKVCDPKTDKIITVPAKDASKYKPVGDIACKPPVKVCNPANGQIITVPASEASNYKPVGDEACKDIQVCDFASKSIKTIKGYQFDSNTMSKDLNAPQCKPEDKKVNVCNPETGEIIQVPESEAGNYKPVDDEACKPVQVCNPATGEIITVKASEASKYKPVDDEACKEDVQVCNPATGEIISVKPSEAANYKPVDDAACVEVPETPETPEVKGESTPEEIPSTGPAEALSALFGTGALAGTTTAYIRSRRALK